MRDRQWPDKPWCRPSGPWLRVPQERRKACLAAGALAGAFTGTGPRFLRLIPLRHLVDHRPHQIVAAAVASASSHRAPPSVHAACEQSRDDWPCLPASRATGPVIPVPHASLIITPMCCCAPQHLQLADTRLYHSEYYSLLSQREPSSHDTGWPQRHEADPPAADAW